MRNERNCAAMRCASRSPQDRVAARIPHANRNAAIMTASWKISASRTSRETARSRNRCDQSERCAASRRCKITSLSSCSCRVLPGSTKRSVKSTAQPAAQSYPTPSFARARRRLRPADWPIAPEARRDRRGESARFRAARRPGRSARPRRSAGHRRGRRSKAPCWRSARP